MRLDSRHRTVPSVCAVNRTQLGQRVRETWIRWARTQPGPKPSWLVPWDELGEPDREADRMIGEDLFGLGWEEGQLYGREHVIQVSADDLARLREFLAHPNGTCSLGRRLNFSACGGGVLICTEPYRARLDEAL